MNSVPAVLDTEVRTASARARAEEPRDSRKATFQDAVEAKREERARSTSERDGAKTQDAGGDRDPVREPEAEAAEDPHETEAEPASNEGGSIRRATTRNAKGAAVDRASAATGDVVLAELDLGGLADSTPDVPTPMILPEAIPAIPTIVAAAPVRGGAPASEPRVAPPEPASPGAAPTAGLEVVSLAASPTSGEASSNAAATRVSVSTAHAVDPRAAPAPETAPAREPIAPRVSPAELPDFLQDLVVRVDSPQRTALVELEPAELGRVSISLSLEGEGHVRADVHTQRPEGYAALEARLPELRASLIERGFLDASVNLSLGLPDARSQRSGAEGGRENPSLRRGRTLAESEIRALLPAAPARPGAIDLWA